MKMVSDRATALVVGKVGLERKEKQKKIISLVEWKVQ